MNAKAAEITLRDDAELPADQVVALYDAVGWTAYTADPASLHAALVASTWVVSAWHDQRLIGLARVLSDNAHVAYLQDILVHPDLQGSGVGRALAEAFLEQFSHVRQKVLLCDGTDGQARFYESLGFTNLAWLRKTPLAAFVRIEGVDLR